MLLYSCKPVKTEKKQKGDDVDTEKLLQGISAGDKASLEQLYLRTSSAVYGFALSILKNAHDAEDVLHDCYIAVWENAAGYRPQGKPLAWILTITKNLCMQLLRGRKRSSELAEDDWEPYFTDADSISVEDRCIIGLCMEKLDDTERQIVSLHAITGLRHREIASILGLPLSTVLSKYTRALKKLRKHLQ